MSFLFKLAGGGSYSTQDDEQIAADIGRKFD